MVEMLKQEATELYFALRCDCDEATRNEIERDLRFFVAKVERNTELTTGIRRALIRLASR